MKKRPAKEEDLSESHNPYLRRLAQNGKQSKAYWKSKGLEKGLAKKVNGRRTAGSGNKREKGDVRRKGICRLEHKATQKKSFSITKDMLDKIENAAMGSDEVPAIIVSFLDANGNVEKEVAVIPIDELLRAIS